VVDDEADIWFVDTHTEGDGRDNYLDLTSLPVPLNLTFLIWFHASVIMVSFDATCTKLCGDVFALFPREAVYDTTLVLVFFLDDLLNFVKER